MKRQLIGVTMALVISLVSIAPVSAKTTAPRLPTLEHKSCTLDGKTYPHGSIEKIDGKFKECMDGKWITHTRTDLP